MRVTMRTPAGMPLRALIVALLAGFGLWQAWQCTDGMMTSPMAATTMTATMTAHDLPAGHDTQPASAVPDQPDPGIPAGMAGLCISVLASFAAALILLASPLKLLGLLRRFGQVLLRPIEMPVRAPVLAQLFISRT